MRKLDRDLDFNKILVKKLFRIIISEMHLSQTSFMASSALTFHGGRLLTPLAILFPSLPESVFQELETSRRVRLGSNWQHLSEEQKMNGAVRVWLVMVPTWGLKNVITASLPQPYARSSSGLFYPEKSFQFYLSGDFQHNLIISFPVV